jgi:hypothetical protein
VGGGSVMDCCKAVSLAARYQGDDLWADFFAQPGVIDFEPLPLGIIVTVSGTGSEMNGGAVITNEELKVKTGRDYPKCNAKFALMDPAYTLSVPKFQMISGGFDTLSHIEDEALRDIALTTTTVENWDEYDTVLIGYPIWWGIAAWPVNGFVSANDFTGKTVIPFCTAYSSGIGQSGTLLEQLTGTGTWQTGHRFTERPSQADIESWVETLNLK